MSTLKVNSIEPRTGSTINVASGNVFSAPGHVLQIVQGVKTDTFTSNSQTTFVDIGLSVAITPSSASSKVLIAYRVCTSIVAGGYSCALILVRGSTNIALGDAEGSRTRVTTMAQSSSASAAGYNVFYQTTDFLDSPNTTSATTYKVTARGWNAQAGNFYINRSEQDSNTASFTRGISTITAMEIAQ